LIGSRISPKWAVAPVLGKKPEKLQSRFARWPTVNTVNGIQSRAILLLCKAFNWSTAAHQDHIDSILSEAWRVLQGKLLTSFGDSYQLDLKELSFRLPETVYLCPVSRRFIDTPFEQLSP
ncbi:hypothetical protein AAIH74_35520, partial [Pseudomonas aeruginosa]